MVKSINQKRFKMPKGKWIPLTSFQEEKIRDEYLNKPIKRIAQELGISFGRVMRFLSKNDLVIPSEVIEARKRSNQFKTGCISHNKGKRQIDYMSPESIQRTKATRFKKGNIPHNTKFDGHERISKDGYVEIRISKGKYRLKHLLNWENQNGLIPESHCLRCIDGDKTNTDPSNWKLISRSENMLHNSIHEYPKEIIPSLEILNQINKKIKQHTNGKEKQ